MRARFLSVRGAAFFLFFLTGSYSASESELLLSLSNPSMNPRLLADCNMAADATEGGLRTEAVCLEVRRDGRAMPVVPLDSSSESVELSK